jgi:Tfp pilus assembly protein PilF
MTTHDARGFCSHALKQRWLLILLLIGKMATAHAATPYDNVSELNTAGRYKEAYELAKTLRSEHEGEPEFDLLFATAALESGHTSEGVLALERVVSLQPDNFRARLALARGYYLVGDDVRARREFERVLASRPSEQLATTIQSYLAAIRQREARYETSARGYLQLGLGRDSNINSAPEDGLADALLPIQLSPDATRINDSFYELSLGGVIDHPLTRRTALFATLDGVMRNHMHEERFDSGLVTGQGGVKWLRDRYMVKGSLVAQQFIIDDNVSRNLYGLSAEMLYTINARQSAGISGNYVVLKNPENELRDSAQYIAGLSFIQRWSGAGQPQVMASAFGGAERSDQDDDGARSVADRSILGVRLAGSYKMSDRWGLQLLTLWQQSEYTAPYLGLAFMPERSEDYKSAEFSLNWLIDPRWKVATSYAYSSNNSNVDMFNYSRNVARLNLRRDF